jgi:hypothetical protein
VNATGHLLRRGLCFVLLAASSTSAATAELRSVEVWMEDGRYHLISESLINATQDDLYAVLIDYELFKKFTSAIVASKNDEPDEEGRPQFYTRMQGCVLLYCKTFVRRGHLLLKPKHDITAVADPKKSDFEFSRERWRLNNGDDGTVMVYEFEMEPRFWIPPFVGPLYIKRALKSGSIRAVNRIEALARGEEPEP